MSKKEKKLTIKHYWVDSKKKVYPIHSKPEIEARLYIQVTYDRRTNKIPSIYFWESESSSGDDYWYGNSINWLIDELASRCLF